MNNNLTKRDEYKNTKSTEMKPISSFTYSFNETGETNTSYFAKIKDWVSSAK